MRLRTYVSSLILICGLPICQATPSVSSPNSLDSISAQVLSHPVRAFEEGSTSPSDLAATIHRNFPIIIEQNVAQMSNDKATRWFDELSSIEIEHLAQLYVNSNFDSTREGKLLLLMAQRLDGIRLGRLANYFGYNEVYAALLIASPAKEESFKSHASNKKVGPTAGAALRMRSTELRGGMAHPMDGFKPSVGMTFEELYAGFRSMQVGSMAATAATYETLMYSGKQLAIAWGIGYEFGSGITYLMQEYTPDFYYNSFVPAVGGTIASSVDYVQDAVHTIYDNLSDLKELGTFESRSIPEFGNSSGIEREMGRTGGDYGMEQEFQEVFGDGGSCNEGYCPQP